MVVISDDRLRMPDGLAELQHALEADWPAKLAELRASGAPVNAYDSLTTRGDVDARMPEEVSNAFLRGLNGRSAVLSSFLRVPVGSAQTRFPVLSALPVAYWVNGDTGLKQTSRSAWRNKFLNIEELAVILPIPEAVLDDAGFPIWDSVRPLCEQAGGRLIDETVFFGVNAPSSFPTNVVAAATAVGNVVARGTNDARSGGFVTDIGDLMSRIEEGGADPFTGLGRKSIKGHARKARNVNGDRFAEVTITRSNIEIDGLDITFPMPGQWPDGSGRPEVIALDPAEFVCGVRQDVTWKFLDQAVIQDDTGAIVYNLAQQDMVAMRMVMRVGWQVANTINYEQPDEAQRYPAGVLVSP